MSEPYEVKPEVKASCLSYLRNTPSGVSLIAGKKTYSRDEMIREVELETPFGLKFLKLHEELMNLDSSR